MSYAKVPLPCADYALGYQDINQLALNAEAALAALSAKHGTATPLNLGPWAGIGTHNDDLVPRSVGRWRIITQHLQKIMVEQLGGPAVLGVARLALGRYFVAVGSLPTWYAVVRLEQTGSAAQFHVVTKSDASQTLPAGFLLETFTQASANAAFAAADLNFCFSIWGTP